MLLKKFAFFFFFILTCTVCFDIKAQKKANFLENLLKEDTSQIIYQVLYHPSQYRLQIIYTQIDRDQNNKMSFRDYFYGDSTSYFYPASLVKLPVAALALEKLNSLNNDSLNRYTKLKTFVKCSSNDSQAEYSTIENDIIQMLVVSDNNAFNRLYEFLGQEYIHNRLKKLGYTNTRIIQRLSSCEGEEHRRTGPFQFLDSNDRVIYEEGLHVYEKQLSNSFKNPKVGKAYYDGRKLIKKPRDFKYSNSIALKELQQMLIALIYPGSVSRSKRFDLTEDDLQFLRKYMSILPRETGIPDWQDSVSYYDSFRKFLLFGDRPEKIDENIRLFNKVGLAYGFISDCAYVVDYKNNIEFFLSAVIYVNEDEVLNDSKYEYTSTGFPFIAQLGRIIYDYELKNRRQKNFTARKLNYDGDTK
jgi:hypothetical protein